MTNGKLPELNCYNFLMNAGKTKSYALNIKGTHQIW